MHALELVLVLDGDLEIDRIEFFEKIKIFNHVDFVSLKTQLDSLAKLPYTGKHANRILLTWLEALGYKSEWLKLSENEFRNLKNYLYANELMVRCKKVAARLSPVVWEEIESYMLTIHEQ